MLDIGSGCLSLSLAVSVSVSFSVPVSGSISVPVSAAAAAASRCQVASLGRCAPRLVAGNCGRAAGSGVTLIMAQKWPNCAGKIQNAYRFAGGGEWESGRETPAGMEACPAKRNATRRCTARSLQVVVDDECEPERKQSKAKEYGKRKKNEVKTN